MKNLGYVFRRLFDMDYGAMLKKINMLHKKTGRSRLWILRDMQRCAVNYGAGYMDYDLYEMYNLTAEQRDTYLTRGRMNELVRKYNDQTKIHVFDSKAEFNVRFAAYLNRDWVDVTEENREKVMAFLQKHERYMAKPVSGSCGKGVELWKREDFASIQEAYDKLYAMEGHMILEQLIVQHPAVSAVYPNAINTVRTLTITKDGVAHIVATCWRIGNNGKHVDNFYNGGMVVPVDEKTGQVTQRAMDKEKNIYPVHPYTGNAIEGFRFPDWDKAMDMVKRAALEVPGVGFVGWDVAFGEDGPCLVEGNDFPSHGLYQLPEHTPDKIGIMPRFNV